MTDPDRPAVPGWDPPTDDELRRILAETRAIAVVGASADPDRPSTTVLRYLQEHTSFELFPVHPSEPEILGMRAYPSLEELPITPDLVDVFRRAEHLPEVARQTVAIGAKVFWAQLGLWSVDAAGVALDGGLWVVMDRCLKIEHRRLTAPGA
jgi:predicted CoA-binding protein